MASTITMDDMLKTGNLMVSGSSTDQPTAKPVQAAKPEGLPAPAPRPSGDTASIPDSVAPSPNAGDPSAMQEVQAQQEALQQEIASLKAQIEDQRQYDAEQQASTNPAPIDPVAKRHAQALQKAEIPIRSLQDLKNADPALYAKIPADKLPEVARQLEEQNKLRIQEELNTGLGPLGIRLEGDAATSTTTGADPSQAALSPEQRFAKDRPEDFALYQTLNASGDEASKKKAEWIKKQYEDSLRLQADTSIQQMRAEAKGQSPGQATSNGGGLFGGGGDSGAMATGDGEGGKNGPIGRFLRMALPILGSSAAQLIRFSPKLAGKGGIWGTVLAAGGTILGNIIGRGIDTGEVSFKPEEDIIAGATSGAFGFFQGRGIANGLKLKGIAQQEQAVLNAQAQQQRDLQLVNAGRQEGIIASNPAMSSTVVNNMAQTPQQVNANIEALLARMAKRGNLPDDINTIRQQLYSPGGYQVGLQNAELLLFNNPAAKKGIRVLPELERRIANRFLGGNRPANPIQGNAKDKALLDQLRIEAPAVLHNPAVAGSPARYVPDPVPAPVTSPPAGTGGTTRTGTTAPPAADLADDMSTIIQPPTRWITDPRRWFGK
jgi:hypothetical protein